MLISEYIQGSLVAQTVKNLPAVWETRVQFLGQEDPLERGRATYSSILPGESHGQRSLGGYSSWGCKELDMTEATEHTRHTYPFMLTVLLIKSKVKAERENSNSKEQPEINSLL